MTQSCLLQVNHLSITIQQYSQGLRRRTLHPVQDLCLTIYPGEMLALVGASGSGKSLLAAAILGTLPYNAVCTGEMTFLERPLTPERQRRLRGREISLIPQSVNSLDPLCKVGRQIRMGDGSAAARRGCRTLLARYGLEPEVEDLYPFQLSGGMARRVLIAAALFKGPRLVVADEPTPGLDRPAAQQVLAHFRELVQSGLGMLLITHDLPLALEVADRVQILYDGRTVEEAPAAAFLHPETLAHPYTRALLAARPEQGLRAPEGDWPYGEGTTCS